ncbi:MAG: helix-turn-helix domain-containing protein [Myxococcota bacterium]
MRARLIVSARRLFAEKGFGETSTPEIVRDAKVTRGALYHHFEDKTDLFRAVVLAEASALEAEISQAGSSAKTNEEALHAGTEAFFEAMRTPGRTRLLLLEGPAVLGVQEMDAIDAGNGRASLLAGLRGVLPNAAPQTLDALSKVLSAAFDRAALAISDGEDSSVYTQALMALVRGLA